MLKKGERYLINSLRISGWNERRKDMWMEGRKRKKNYGMEGGRREGREVRKGGNRLIGLLLVRKKARRKKERSEWRKDVKH